MAGVVIVGLWLVRGFEGLGDLLGDGQGLIYRDGTLRDAVGECRSLDQFHDQRSLALTAFEAVDRRDVGMVERRERLGFAVEAGQAFRVLRH